MLIHKSVFFQVFFLQTEKAFPLSIRSEPYTHEWLVDFGASAVHDRFGQRHGGGGEVGGLDER